MGAALSGGLLAISGTSVGYLSLGSPCSLAWEPHKQYATGRTIELCLISASVFAGLLCGALSGLSTAAAPPPGMRALAAGACAPCVPLPAAPRRAQHCMMILMSPQSYLPGMLIRLTTLASSASDTSCRPPTAAPSSATPSSATDLCRPLPPHSVGRHRGGTTFKATAESAGTAAVRNPACLTKRGPRANTTTFTPPPSLAIGSTMRHKACAAAHTQNPPPPTRAVYVKFLHPTFGAVARPKIAQTNLPLLDLQRLALIRQQPSLQRHMGEPHFTTHSLTHPPSTHIICPLVPTVSPGTEVFLITEPSFRTATGSHVAEQPRVILGTLGVDLF